MLKCRMKVACSDNSEFSKAALDAVKDFSVVVVVMDISKVKVTTE